MMKKCTIRGCKSRDLIARRMCEKHYRRWKRHGDANVVNVGKFMVSPGTILIMPIGGKPYLRIAPDLIPEDIRGKPLNFIATIEPESHKVYLKAMLRTPDNGTRHTGVGLLLRGWYTKKHITQSIVMCAVRIFKFAGVKTPKASKQCTASVTPDGTIELSLS